MTDTASPEPTTTRPGSGDAAAGEDANRDEQTSATSTQIETNANHQQHARATPEEPETNGQQQATSNASPASEKVEDGQPPAKRRRIRDTTPHDSPRKPKLESPPWKKVAAEGPSSFTEAGRRKSGRINMVPIELQSGDKRITRRALHSLQDSPPKPRYSSGSLAAAAGPSSATATPTRPSQNSHKTSSSKPHRRSSSSGAKQPQPPPPSKPPTRKPPAFEPAPTRKSTRRASSPKPAPSTPQKPPAGTRRSARHTRDSLDNNDASPGGGGVRSTRIKLKARAPLTTLPLVHRDQASLRPKLGPSFEEYFDHAASIPVENGGMMAADDPPPYTDETATADARMVLRVEKEVEPGGILSEEKCSLFEPEPEEEPPRQWAHMDHLVKAATNFRRLLFLEQQRHRAAAKKLALACEAEWKRRNPQPKTAEDVEREERARAEQAWRQVARAVSGTWENVRLEINRRRLAEWEAAEQRRVKAALNEAVSLSEQKLQARQARLDTDELTEDMAEEDEDEDVDDGDGASSQGHGTDSLDSDISMDESDLQAEDDDDDDMSSDDDGGDADEDHDRSSVLSDEGLTQDQLREKYAHLPDFNPDGADRADGEDGDGGDGADGLKAETEDGNDTSDESVDMEDDMGSTEDEMDSDGDRDEGGSDGDGEESEEDNEPNGLIGLFFGKSELKKMKEEAVEEMASEPAQVEETQDVEMVDAEEPPVETNGRPAKPEDDASVAPTNGMTNGGTAGSPMTVDKGEPLPGARPSAAENTLTTSTPPVSSEGETTNPKTNGVAADPCRVIPDVEVTEPPADPEQQQQQQEQQPPTPETDAITNLPTPSRSQSPRTSDTKPSDVETPTSVELLGARKSDSRALSPQSGVPKTEIPFLLRGTLREYQHHGLDWLAGLYANKTNGILADEMGLGKTIQTIALLAHLACQHEVWGPHLVVVPTSVMLNWEMEFKKWCPGFKILTYYGNQEERKRKRHGWTNDDIWNVCITSYQIVLQDQQVFKRRRWHFLILDEAHNIKNFKSQRWQTLLGFNTHSRLLLTGTPLQNNLTELWSLLFFLMPPENGQGGFADLREFHDWFHKPESQILESGREQMDDEARAIIAKLHKVLRPYLLRRLKADVERQMPAKYEHVEFCRLSKRQRELYDGFLSRTDTRRTLASGNYLSIINCLMQLRKVCNHPDLFVDRPIMTSFRMHGSVPAAYAAAAGQLVRGTLLAEKPMSTVSLAFLNLIPTRYEDDPAADHADRVAQLSSHRILLDLRDAQKARAQNAYGPLDPASVKSNLAYLESAARWGRFEELQHCVYLNALRRQRRPVYGRGLVSLLTLDTHNRPFKPRPRVPQNVMSWFEEDSTLLRRAVPTLPQRAAAAEITVSKFACVTPAVVTRDLEPVLLGDAGVDALEGWNLRLAAPVKRGAPYVPAEAPPDPWHEARMRLSIQFPDKRLLQYDCGKLQALDKLLRRLQAGGHRALIFTQMTRVLNILEQFLNIHGHKYLRLDGATKVEQRQILTDRFNHDSRILCFILSTRSGGLGINLTGADTVIFYDQDWNPAMDKQCQDRCHRIGQTRDVHIYRLVSEHTIEANILRKASQKQMLDDVVIQEGEFTTDHKQLAVRDEVTSSGEVRANENDVAASAAMERVLGGVVDSAGERHAGRVLEQAEDREDVAAARAAEREIQQDDADFVEQRTTPGAATPGVASGVSSARHDTPRDTADITVGKTGQSVPDPLSGSTPLGENGTGGDLALAPLSAIEPEETEYNADGGRMHTVDDYMLEFMSAALEGTPLELPRDKKKSKKKKGKDTRKR